MARETLEFKVFRNGRHQLNTDGNYMGEPLLMVSLSLASSRFHQSIIFY